MASQSLCVVGQVRLVLLVFVILRTELVLDYVEALAESGDAAWASEVAMQRSAQRACEIVDLDLAISVTSNADFAVAHSERRIRRKVLQLVLQLQSLCVEHQDVGAADTMVPAPHEELAISVRQILWATNHRVGELHTEVSTECGNSMGTVVRQLQDVPVAEDHLGIGASRALFRRQGGVPRAAAHRVLTDGQPLATRIGQMEGERSS